MWILTNFYANIAGGTNRVLVLERVLEIQIK